MNPEIVVYKFGGASIASPDRMRHLLPIIRQENRSLVLVISAYGKTTDALEKAVTEIEQKKLDGFRQNTETVKQAHLDYAKEILSEASLKEFSEYTHSVFSQLSGAAFFEQSQYPDAIYDGIVSTGELLSSKILALFLQDNDINAVWVDARHLIRTDDCFRDAKVDENTTQKNINQIIPSLLTAQKTVITQGFIGCTLDGQTTTLGREGSDYSGALLASMLHAESLTIWKDVEGFLTADPRRFPEAERIPEITFHEVVEMAFYGAQVIHPKTIKPLQNAGIPLFVKCFLKSDLPGTIVHHTEKEIKYPPLIVLKEEQTLIQVTSRDFSFITEDNLSYLYGLIHRFRLKINLTQNAAISVVFVVNNEQEKITEFTKAVQDKFAVLHNDHQSLLTIRHYTNDLVQKLTKNKAIILTQKTRQTIQMVF